MEVRPVIPMQSTKAPVPTAEDTKGKKEYMLLIYESESQWEKLTDAQRQAIRKEIVSDMIAKWGEIEEKASQMGSANIEAQNAKDRAAR